MPKVVVLIPTFDHGPTLLPAIHSALNQTETDVAVHVIGDGAPDSTDVLMEQVTGSEQKVHYHPHAKSPRTGEPYRHELLQSVECEFVAYLSDDDILAPDHVERVTEPLARGVDFAATLTLLLGEGEPELMRVDLGDPSDRAMLLGSVNRITLSVAAHRWDSYLRLPFGWRTAPADEWTDHWMWKQWLAEPWVTAESVPALTAIHVPRQYRDGMSNEEMAAANWEWVRRTSDEWWSLQRDAVLIAAANTSSRLAEQRLAEVLAVSTQADATESALRADLHVANERADGLQAQSENADTASRLAAQQRDELLKSSTWRLTQPLRSCLDGLRRTRVR